MDCWEADEVFNETMHEDLSIQKKAYLGAAMLAMSKFSDY